ncbi:MAG: hypothetical protein V1830_01280 [Candidatus Omnitrophota bacterium]
MCFIKWFYSEDECKSLAYRLYEGRNREPGHQEKDYLEAKRMIKGRVWAGLFYLALGFLLVKSANQPDGRFFNLIRQIFANMINFVINRPNINDIYIWCVGWAAVGLGAGLINTRIRPYKIWWLQHIGYCVFVLFIVSALAYAIPVYIDNNASSDRFYLLSMLIGLIGGFFGDTLNETVKNLLKFPRS